MPQSVASAAAFGKALRFFAFDLFELASLAVFVGGVAALAKWVGA